MRLCERCNQRVHVVQKRVMDKKKKKWWLEECAKCGHNWEITEDEPNSKEKVAKWFKYSGRVIRRRKV